MKKQKIHNTFPILLILAVVYSLLAAVLGLQNEFAGMFKMLLASGLCLSFGGLLAKLAGAV